MFPKLKYYIESMRLRTLPLAVSGVIVGAALAAYSHSFQLSIFILALLTAISLQIVSNIANELGDLEKGTDNEFRQGPIRSVQRGNLTYKNVLNFLYLFLGISAVVGLILVYFSFDSLFSREGITMLILGAFAMIASVKYTFGNKAYGYIGLGDVFVFLFFGLVAVIGVYYLMTKTINSSLLLPASAIGLLSTAMLNQNNMRDIKNDEVFKKKTVVVRMGIQHARIYHLLLILLAFLFMSLFVFLFMNNDLRAYLFLLSAPIFIYHLLYVFKSSDKALDKHMKIISLGTLIFALLFAISLFF